MAKKTNRFITIEIFDDNLSDYQGNTLSERVSDWLTKSPLSAEPVVISPLHTPDDGRKPHVHTIVDVTNFEHPELTWFEGLCKTYKLPKPQDVRNIYCMELYLTHDTAQARREEKQTFSADEKATMVYINNYAFHEPTDRAKREELSVVIALISERIETAIDNGCKSDNRSLSRLLRDPEFYSEIECAMSFDVLKAKAKNELKTHWRYYQEYANDYRNDKQQNEYKTAIQKRDESVKALREDNAHYGAWLVSMLNLLTDRDCHNVLNAVYCNDDGFRYHLKQLGIQCIANINHRKYIEDYITYCCVENSATEHLQIICEFLQHFTNIDIYKMSVNGLKF